MGLDDGSFGAGNDEGNIGFLSRVTEGSPFLINPSSCFVAIEAPPVYNMVIDPCEGDFDRDGDVDGSDLGVFAEDFGRIDCPILP